MKPINPSHNSFNINQEASFIREPILVFSLLPLFFIIILFFPVASHAVPAIPGKHILTQPDGTIFTARQWGDEFQHGWETLDGNSIEFDEGLNSWTYLTTDINNKIVRSSKIAGRDYPPLDAKHLRPLSYISTEEFAGSNLITNSTDVSQQAVSVTGTNYIPVILVNFNDTTTTYSNTDFNNLLFGTGNYSMKDYYQEVSYGLFSVSAGPEGVAGWYTVSKTHNYYGQNDSSGTDMWPGDLVYEAVAAADSAGFDFAPYDQDGDCYVDVVNIIHQGPGAEAGGLSTDIWSHRWSLNSALAWGKSHYGVYTTNDNCTSNPSAKVKVDGYVIQPEILWGGMQTMGVFAHEYAHALGLPDLYDTDYSSEGIGYWSLMAAGTWNYVTTPGDRPAHMDAWSKYFLGWISPTQVSTTLTDQPITRASSASDVYQLLDGSPLSGEYFLIENRQRTGFDSGLPGTGLLIWHIDGDKISSKINLNQVNNTACYPPSNCSSNHYGVALVQADNLWGMEKGFDSGDSGDPYNGNNSFTATSSPNSRLYNNSPSNVSITNISGSGAAISATISVLSADLIVETLTGPATGTPGSNITINYSVKNNGSGTAPASTTKFFWSTDTLIDSGDTDLGRKSMPVLTSEAISAGRITVKVPANTCSGTYYILAAADADNIISETIEDNNTNNITITISPDLIVSMVSARPKAGAGQDILIKSSTKNIGSCSAGASTTKIYLSSDSEWDAGDSLVGSRDVTILTKGRSNTGGIFVTIPTEVTAGTYYIIAMADADDVVTELSEANNNKSRSILIGPDLVVSALSAKSSAGRGTIIKIKDTIKNYGGGSSVPSTAAFYLSTDTSYDAGDTLLGSRALLSIPSRTASAGTTFVTLPSEIAAGTYYIIERADADNIFSETNETNNDRSFSITITP